MLRARTVLFVVQATFTTKIFGENMKRRTLDLSMSVGGTLLAVLAAVLGLVFQANANFATTYVRDQLDRKSTRLNSSHVSESRMPSSA